MKIALAQVTSGIDPVANAETLVAAVAEAARGGATMLFTPEMSGLLDRDRARAAQVLRSEADDVVLARCVPQRRNTASGFISGRWRYWGKAGGSPIGRS